MDEAENIDIVSRLETFLEELQDYQSSRSRLIKRKRLRSDEVTRFKELFDDIVGKVGAFGSRITELSDMDRVVSGQKECDMWFMGLRVDSDPLTDSALDICIYATKKAIGKLKSEITGGKRDKITGELIGKTKVFNAKPLKAFIAHEGETKALTKLIEFLDALKIKPIVAEKSPSDSSLIEPHVGSNIHKGDFVIILATKGKAINKETNKPYMGLNVADELGRSREANKKVILLLEKDVDPHTNVSGIARERFTPGSMDKAFIKIVRELANWGFIISGTTKE